MPPDSVHEIREHLALLGRLVAKQDQDLRELRRQNDVVRQTLKNEIGFLPCENLENMAHRAAKLLRLEEKCRPDAPKSPTEAEDDPLGTVLRSIRLESRRWALDEARTAIEMLPVGWHNHMNVVPRSEALDALLKLKG